MGISLQYSAQKRNIDMTHELMVGGFCDWITVSQQHEEKHDYADTTYQVVCTKTGELQISKNNPVQHKGSYETSVRIQTNSGRITLSGNVGRFGRPDNLFGYSVDTVKRQANEIISSLGLPPFSAGTFHRIDNGRKENSTLVYTGAKISRIDITTNLCANSKRSEFLNWAAQQQPSRMKTTTYGDGQTVYYRTTLKTSKLYNKSEELIKHDKTNLRYTKKLIEFCDQHGIVRHETTFKNKFLDKYGLKPWCKCTSENIQSHYLVELNKINRTHIMNELQDLPLTIRGTYYAYINGENMNQLSKSTFYRHRKELLKIGVDIAAPFNIVSIKTQPRVLELDTPTIPKFYQVA